RTTRDPSAPSSAFWAVTRHNMVMQNMRLRVLRDDDLDEVVALNDAAVPAVNALGRDGFIQLREHCDVQLVASDRDGTVLAFLMSMGTGLPYESENYQWFEARKRTHQYIDRIVVGPKAKGTGI